MLIVRVRGRRLVDRGLGADASSCASPFDIVKPPPRTPNLPATAGSASTAATALPPLRLRSRPQPTRITAGELRA